jgi:hypothetical protein
MLLTELGWTVPSSPCPAGTVGGVAVYECTLTAPVSAQADPLNDSDCDSDDFEFGIPVGCSIGFTTETNLLANNAVVDVSTNGDPLAPITPEPGTLLLVSIGALAMLPSFVRRIRRPV